MGGFLLVIFILLAIIIPNIMIVPQFHEFVVELLGTCK